MMVRRWKCVCAYDGTPFAGWQSQAGGLAIQDLIETRLAQIFKGPVRVHGRTDSTSAYGSSLVTIVPTAGGSKKTTSPSASWANQVMPKNDAPNRNFVAVPA